MYGKLVGALHKKGTFTNQDTGELVSFDNIELVVLVPPKIGGSYDPVEAVGFTTEKKCKFPADSISDVFGKDVKSIDDINPLIDSDIEFFYDGSKRVCKVMINE
jgi:hypothetical protein